MVMPRSFSRSLLSMTRSATCWWEANVPAWLSSLSTMVVLPWSTWAMMAILRSSRDMETALLYEKGAHSSTRDAGTPYETEKAAHHEGHEEKSHFVAGSAAWNSSCPSWPSW